jgi:hypothetical protein
MGLSDQPWTAGEEQRLAKLKKAGMTNTECAQELGRPVASVTCKCQRMGLRKSWRRDKKAAEDYAKRADTEAENRLLSQQLEKAQESLERERKRRRVDFGSAKRAGKSFLRVTFGDTHGCRVDKLAFAAFVADLKVLQPAEIVCMGDHLDCDGFLSSHKPIGYTSLSDYSFADDVAAANDMFDQIAKAAPGAVVHYLEGNHEARIRTWCRDNSENDRDKAFHERHYLPPNVLDLESRGVKFYPLHEQHCGLSKRGTIKLGKCHFVHGDSHAKRAAEAHLNAFAANVVFAHTHRAEMFASSTESSGTIAAWNPGCLCERHPMWQHSKASTWTHGYGLQFCENKTGNFQHVNVTIHEGLSLMGCHLKAMGFNP